MKVILAMNSTSRFRAITFDTRGSLLPKVAANQSYVRTQRLNVVSFNAAFMGIEGNEGPVVPLMGTVHVDRSEFWVTAFNDDSQDDDESETVNDSDLVQASELGVDVLVLCGEHRTLDEFIADHENMTSQFFDTDGHPLKVGLRSFWAPGVNAIDTDQVMRQLTKFSPTRDVRMDTVRVR